MEQYPVTKEALSQFLASFDTLADDIKRWDWEQLLHPSTFKLTERTPFYDFRFIFATCPMFLGFIFLFSVFMKMRKAPLAVPNWVGYTHNFILCIWSLAMCVGMLYGTFLKYQTSGAYSTVCEQFQTTAMDGHFGYWMLIYYISKYYEWLDTVLIVAKKNFNQLSFLHVYHHFIIVPLSWSWLYGDFSLAWIGVTLNTLVHVFMYWYYYKSMRARALNSKKYEPWWKSYITMGQITQFAIVFTMLWVHAPLYMKTFPELVFTPGDLIPALVFEKGCVGPYPWVFMFSLVIDTSFFFLFVQFFFQAYGTKRPSSKGGRPKKD